MKYCLNITIPVVNVFEPHKAVDQQLDGALEHVMSGREAHGWYAVVGGGALRCQFE